MFPGLYLTEDEFHSSMVFLEAKYFSITLTTVKTSFANDTPVEVVFAFCHSSG